MLGRSAENAKGTNPVRAAGRSRLRGLDTPLLREGHGIPPDSRRRGISWSTCAARLGFALRGSPEKLEMQLVRLHFLGVPCPRWLLPAIVAEETATTGRLHFRVQASLPLVGVVTQLLRPYRAPRERAFMIVVFDAQCLLCSRWVKFLLKYDRRALLRSASIQGEAGQALLAQAGLRVRTGSDATPGRWHSQLATHGRHHPGLARVGWPWRAAWLAWPIPEPVRDAIYRLNARNCYSLLGRSETCLMPPADYTALPPTELPVARLCALRTQRNLRIVELDHVAQARQEIQATRTVTHPALLVPLVLQITVLYSTLEPAMPTMKAAVVREFGQPLHIEDVPVPEVGARHPGQVMALGRVPHRPACGRWRLAGQAQAAVHSRPRRCRLRRSGGRRREVGQGRRSRRCALAAHRLWPLRALHDRLGNAMRRAADDRLLRQRRLRRYVLADPGYVGHLPANVGFAAIAPVLCAGVTVYKGLKMLDSQARATGWRSPASAGSGTWRCSTPRPWGFTSPRSTSTTPSSSWRRRSAPKWSSMPPRPTRPPNCSVR